MILSRSPRSSAAIGSSLPLDFFAVSRRRAARRQRVDVCLTECAKYLVLTLASLFFALMFAGVL